MSLLDLDSLLATAIAYFIGMARFSSWKGKSVICLLLAFVAWKVRYAAILQGDAATAEDYFNDLDALMAAAEISVAFAWALIWCGLGFVTASLIRRARSKSRRPLV